ncbi:hypothetical protein [Amycolatopsis sp. EV170708-02-1]|uniref:hypothetical protein n=1 Tax=Amycolatopsis sp. EV170708-02-1 TaxID=2919322 RepID=UPI001F0C3306|nr:hypothetical protein [Amycolatopsis sp. EV170708-02-1]UMP00117.1 hypothetical protein MJQ72_26845 [Amycolatopsis sp. EV170708-02-1]
MTVLWWPITAGLTGADLVKARLDALKIGLSIGVGSGSVVALYLAWRRQRSTEADLDNRERALAQQYEVLAHQQTVAATRQAQQERVADDARERRITELCTKAVEQLGSDKAPVRLGGLYALERLAQNNETQRQTIVNVGHHGVLSTPNRLSNTASTVASSHPRALRSSAWTWTRNPAG